MSEIVKRYATDDTFREVANLLFGGGGDEIVAKFNPDGADLGTKTAAQKDRRNRKITAGLSATGAAAGAYGLGVGVNEVRNKSKELGSFKRGLKGTKGSLKALVPLEVAGLGGEVMATHILHNDTKKKITKRLVPLEKSLSPTDLKDQMTNPKRALTQASVTTAARAGGKGTVLAKGKLQKLKQSLGKSEDFDVKWEGEFSKVNTDKQQVFGWASIVEVNGEPVVDLQGDYIAIDEVEKAAYTYVHKSRKGGDMHLRDGDAAVHASDMIESFVVTPEKKEALGLPDEMPTGWWVGYQVNDPNLWGKVKSGERTGFSIHGRGRRADA